MKTKKGKKPDSPILFESESEPERDTPLESGYVPGSKIQVPLTEDGSIDLGTMREKTKERLRAALRSTPGLVEDSAPAVAEPVYIFPPQAIHAMYAATGMLEAVLAERFFKIPAPIAKATFTYTPQELAVLTPPTERVLSKYASEWMIKYKDEIALASLLLSITIQKVNTAVMASRMRAASQEETVQNPEKSGEDVKVQPN